MADDPTKPIAYQAVGILVVTIFVTVALFFVAFIVGSVGSWQHFSNSNRASSDLLAVLAFTLPGVALGLWIYFKGRKLRKSQVAVSKKASSRKS